MAFEWNIYAYISNRVNQWIWNTPFSDTLTSPKHEIWKAFWPLRITNDSAESVNNCFNITEWTC